MTWNESDHPRNKDGEFTDGNGDSGKKKGYDSRKDGVLERAKKAVGKKSAENLPETIKLPDEQLGRSIGAKWRNHDIDMPDGTKAKFVEGSKLQNKEVFAGEGCRTKIDDIDRLVKQYKGSDANKWKKVKAIAQIETPQGEIIDAEVHWYEEPTAGKVEFKFKNEV